MKKISTAAGKQSRKTFFERKGKSPKPSSGDCVNRLAQVPLLGVGSQVD